MVALIDKHGNINLRQTTLYLLKLEIDISVFGIKYRQRGLIQRKNVKKQKAQLKDLDEIIKDEKTSLREEFKKLNGIKDPNAKIWKIRTSVLGPKHKTPEPTCIRHPDTGETILLDVSLDLISTSSVLDASDAAWFVLRLRSFSDFALSSS